MVERVVLVLPHNGSVGQKLAFFEENQGVAIMQYLEEQSLLRCKEHRQDVRQERRPAEHPRVLACLQYNTQRVVALTPHL